MKPALRDEEGVAGFQLALKPADLSERLVARRLAVELGVAPGGVAQGQKLAERAAQDIGIPLPT